MIDPKIVPMLEATINQFHAEGKAFSVYDVTMVTREREHLQLRHYTIRDEIHRLPAMQTIISPGRDYERTLCELCNTSCNHTFVREEGDEEDRCPVCDEDAQITVKGQILIYHPHDYDLSDYELRAEAQPNGPSPAAQPQLPQHQRPQYVTECTAKRWRRSGDGFVPAEGQGFLEPLVRDATLDQLARTGKEEATQQMVTGGSQSVINRLKAAAGTPVLPATEVELDYRNRVEIPKQYLAAIGLKPGDDCFAIPDVDAVNLRIVKINSGNEQEVVCAQKVEHNGNLRIATRVLNMAGLSAKTLTVEIVTIGGIAVVRIRQSE